MQYLVIRLRTKHFDQWNDQFNGRALERKVLGCKNTIILRDSYDPSRVTVLMEWEHTGAKQYFHSLEQCDGSNQTWTDHSDHVFEFLESVGVPVS